MEDETQKEWFGALPIAGLVRRARRIADMSQRQLARAAGVSQSAVSRMETEGLVPSLGLLQRVLGAAGLSLVVADAQGHVVQPMADWDNTRDGAERRYPSHLDTVLDPRQGSGGRTSTVWRDRRRRITGTGSFGTRCGGAVSGRYG